MQGEAATDRRLVSVEGADALPFLQGLVTNDVLRLGKGPGIVWAALLTPQGKYLADFFIVQPVEGALLLDLPEAVADATLRRLTMYRLRADVRLVPSLLHAQRGLGNMPPAALADPRHAALGWRLYGTESGAPPQIDWDAIRVAHVIPETGRELLIDDSYILEAGFERLHGVDFRKGCYVGQEVTARMKHKTDLRKGLARVRVTGPATYGDEITADGKPAGTLFTRAGDHAIAYLRFDRATGQMQAGGATVTLDHAADEAIVQP
jgi:folate-binding protein YgfZ